jgi:hypothetical protein
VLFDLLLTIALAVIVIGIAVGPQILEHPRSPLPVRWAGTRQARLDLAAARTRLAAVTAADRAAGINAETDAYIEANTTVLEAEHAVKVSRRAARRAAVNR